VFITSRKGAHMTNEAKRETKHTPGPWRWLGNHSLVGNHGRRPAVLTARELKQRNPADGLLVDFDPESPDAPLMEAAPSLLAAVIALRAVAFHSQHCPAFPPGCADEPCRCGYDNAEQAAHEAVLKATGRNEAATPAARAAIAKAHGDER
jgi:hypothetical protein